MPILSARGLTKYYGAELILDAVSLTIDERDRIGLIGANGTGKTTLCRLLLQELPADDGTVSLAKGATLGYLPQDPEFAPGQTLWDAAMAAFSAVRDLERRLRECEERMGEAPPHEAEALLQRHERIRGEYEQAGGYDYQVRAATVLTGLGFAEADFPRPLESFSGGEKSRAALATLLLQAPDLLLLDEPTNHLDIQGTEWLEEYLRGYAGAVVAISHDRRFLNNTVRRIVELSSHQLTEYAGDYDAYVRQKEERLLNYQRVYQKQQRERERQLAFIRWALASQQEKLVRAAKSRLKLLEKVDWLEPPPAERRKVNLRFTPRMRGGDEILELAAVAVGYGRRALVAGVDLLLRRGDRVGLVGPNGCGKTTLLRVILQQMSPLAGTVRLGASVEVGYYAQERTALSPGYTVMEEFHEVVSDAGVPELRHLLARFLFVEEDVFKLTEQLSGGEESRLALAKLIMTRPTFLVLDEPTNHLDIDSRAALEHALQEYSGTLLVVSHDRYFLDAVVSRVLVIEDGRGRLFAGNYSAYREALRQKEEERRAAEQSAEQARKRARLQEERQRQRERRPQGDPAPLLTPWRFRRRIAELEARAEQLERRVAAIRKVLGNPGAYGDLSHIAALGVEYDRLQTELAETYAEWETLMEAQG